MNKLYASETNKGLTAFSSTEMALIDGAARNLVAYYASASDETRAAGTAWYSGKAAQLARDVAEQCGIPFETAAGVIAVNSPRTRWTTQVNRTAAFCTHMLNGGSIYDAPKASLYHSTMERAALGLLFGDWSGLNGPKVGPFYRNIIGDNTVVTLDVWAIRAGLGRRDMDEAEINLWTTGRRRLVLEAAYHRAAGIIGEPVADVQAVVWVVFRGSAD